MRNKLCFILCIILIFAPLPFSASAEAINPDEDCEFTVLWTTDPQWYSFKYFDILTKQNDWVVDNYDRMNIRYIIHTGDFVDLPHERAQWDFVSKEYEKWDDAGLEYGVLAGNHDVDASDYTEFKEYFGTARFEGKDCFGEAYDGNRGHYDLLTLGGIDFIFVYLGYGTHSDADYDWMNKVLSENSGRHAFLMFHEYLNADGTRTAIGNEIFNRVVLKNPNVKAVLCGHNYNSTRLVDYIDDDGDGAEDRTVYQLMANYQNIINGGNGFMRFMEFDIDGGFIKHRTYSPYTNSFNAFESRGDDADEYGFRDEFIIPFDFSEPTQNGNGNGKVISKPAVNIGGISLPINYINEREQSADYKNAGIYDSNFSLDARDALSDPENAYFITLDYKDKIGFTVKNIYDSADKTVSIPQNSRVIVISKNAVDENENKFDISGIKVGDAVCFRQINGLAEAKAATHIKLYLKGLDGAFGIDGFNREVKSGEWVIFDRIWGERISKDGVNFKNCALFAFSPCDNIENRYILTETVTETGKDKDIAIDENGFLLAVNLSGRSKILKSSIERLIVSGKQAILNGYELGNGPVYSGESIISKEKSDWLLSSGTFILETDGSALTFSNTDGLWPDMRYTPNEPIKINVNTQGIFYDFDMEKSSQTSIVIHLASGGYIKLNSYFEGVTISSGSGDVKGEGNTANGVIDLSCVEFPSGAVGSDGNVLIKSIQIYASGDPGKKMTLRELRAVDMNDTETELPSDFLEDESSESNVAGAESDASAPDAVNNNGKAPIIIIISALIIVVAVIVIFVLKRHNRKQ
ncbi:MAG: hypothetical protein E7595_03185 [Ruminococcaceae bacterium]|nr:hypothetical protein [Oscillospiraceae bacterium]